MTGIEYDFVKTTNTATSLKINAGYLNGSGFHSAVILPTLVAEYKKVGLEFMYAPASLAHKATDVYACWLRFKF